jgi:PhnB protein
MSIKTLNPYLTLDGTAAKAIKLYESALGAKTETLMRFGDAPDRKAPPEQMNRVMHALLHIGGSVLMLSDTMPGAPTPSGGNVHIALHFDDPADLVKTYEALAVGGKVIDPPQDTFWGAKFGTLVDAFGVQWMFNCELKKS